MKRVRRGTGESEGSRRFTRFVLIPGIILALLGVIGFLTHKPILRRVRAMRSDKILAETRTAIQAGDVMGAHRKLQVALQLAPGKLSVQKLAAEFYTSVGQPDSLFHWDQVRNAAGVSVEDRLAYVDACLKFQRTDLALEELNRLEPTQARSAEFLRRVVRYLIAIEDYPAAVPYAREATMVSVKDEELDYLLGIALYQSGRQEWVTEGRGLLMAIALSPGTKQIPAADRLKLTGRLTMTEGRQIARALERRSDLTFHDRLVVAGLKLGNDAEERARVVGDLGKEVPPANDDERIAYARWAIDSQVPGVAKRFLADLVTTNGMLAGLRVEAAALDQDWTAMEELLARDKDLVDPTVAACVRAWRLSQSGDSVKAEASFRAAIDTATKTLTRSVAYRLWTVSQWAERARLPAAAMAALEPLLADRTQVASASRAILRFGGTLDRYEPAFPAIRALRNYVPNETFVLRFYAYTALLLDLEVADASEVAGRLVAQEPSDPFLQVLAAYGKVRQNRVPEAVEQLGSVGVDPATLNHQGRVLMAAIRHAAGQREAARQMARELKDNPLKFEEKQLLDRIE